MADHDHDDAPNYREDYVEDYAASGHPTEAEEAHRVVGVLENATRLRDGCRLAEAHHGTRPLEMAVAHHEASLCPVEVVMAKVAHHDPSDGIL